MIPLILKHITTQFKDLKEYLHAYVAKEVRHSESIIRTDLLSIQKSISKLEAQIKDQQPTN